MKIFVLFLMITQYLFGVDIVENSDEIDWIFWILILIGLGYAGGILKMIRGGKGKLILILIILGLIFRGYINYSSGGMLIPLSINNLPEWVFNELNLLEIIFWIILICSPYYYVNRDECPECNGINIDVIDKKVLSKDTISKLVEKAIGTDSNGNTIYEKQKEYYNVENIEKTYKCARCDHVWKKTTKKEVLI
jgi:Zn-finger nucleic acid-binding protein